MAKTNYSKVEDSFNEGLLKIDIDRLLEETEKNGAAAKIHLAKQLLISMRFDLRSLQKRGFDPHAELNIDKSTIKTLIQHVDSLTPEEWNVIKETKKKLDKFKLEADQKAPPTSDDAIVEEERRSQMNKRFNVNEKWWPL